MAPEKGSVCICFLALLALTSEGFKYNYAQHANYTCPGWLSDYKATHQALRSNPNATYLVYHCHNNTHCNGAGLSTSRALHAMFMGSHACEACLPASFACRRPHQGRAVLAACGCKIRQSAAP